MAPRDGFIMMPFIWRCQRMCFSLSPGHNYGGPSTHWSGSRHDSTVMSCSEASRNRRCVPRCISEHNFGEALFVCHLGHETIACPVPLRTIPHTRVSRARALGRGKPICIRLRISRCLDRLIDFGDSIYTRYLCALYYIPNMVGQSTPTDPLPQ